MKIVETCNYDSDYPMETFVSLPSMQKEHAEAVVAQINKGFGMYHPRFWKVVDDKYQLNQNSVLD